MDKCFLREVVPSLRDLNFRAMRYYSGPLAAQQKEELFYFPRRSLRKISGSIFGCHNSEGKESTPGIQWVKARDAAN